MTATAMMGGSESLWARCEVELDIFSGMPNPTWILTNDQAASFVERLEQLPRTSARELSGHLGYRGLIVQCARGADTRWVRVQNGIVHISEAGTDLYREDRGLERWLLETGRPHLEGELFRIAEREVR